MVIRPTMINPVPSMVVLMLGGLVGALLMLSLGYAAPLAGWPALDVLRSLGAIFTSRPDVSLAVGAVLFLTVAAALLPLAAQLSWSVLPDADTMGGALLNGLAIAGTWWLLLGVVCGVAATVGRMPDTGAIGWMGAAGGLAGVGLFAGAALCYGVAVALVSLLEQGISPLDALGWPGYTYAATGPLHLGAHRSHRPPAPGRGEQPWRGPR